MSMMMNFQHVYTGQESWALLTRHALKREPPSKSTPLSTHEPWADSSLFQQAISVFASRVIHSDPVYRVSFSKQSLCWETHSDPRVLGATGWLEVVHVRWRQLLLVVTKANLARRSCGPALCCLQRQRAAASSGLLLSAGGGREGDETGPGSLCMGDGEEMSEPLPSWSWVNKCRASDNENSKNKHTHSHGKKGNKILPGLLQPF